ncbi:carbonic anhydrase 9 [Protopterus annectens]|uniref:carbonic anhydrase 9 n=1 Tax=Protopterus annectens TaxID=7888 RepID=UPI001CFC20AC|nr:carbonic anhydrase 9 [Protopterus annectens]
MDNSLIFPLFLVFLGPSHSHWTYEDQHHWATSYPDCGGTSQSPIDIDTRKAVFSRQLPPIELKNDDTLPRAETLTLLNNGHTLQLNLPSTLSMSIGTDVYHAAQLHFHWGTDGQEGSEHSVDGEHYDAEIHVVHYSDKYQNLKEAADKVDGLAVLGAFIQVGEEENAGYQRVLTYLKNVTEEGSRTTVPFVNANDLLPVRLDRYFRYNGSLTTPPCFQSVTWTVFNETVFVSKEQLELLESTLKGDHDSILSGNFRTLQDLNGRNVLASFPSSDQKKSIGSKAPSDEKQSNSVDEDPELPESSYRLGDILAIVFGVLFAITLTAFIIYVLHHRKKNTRSGSDKRENVIYKAAVMQEA